MNNIHPIVAYLNTIDRNIIYNMMGLTASPGPKEVFGVREIEGKFETFERGSLRNVMTFTTYGTANQVAKILNELVVINEYNQRKGP